VEVTEHIDTDVHMAPSVPMPDAVSKPMQPSGPHHWNIDAAAFMPASTQDGPGVSDTAKLEAINTVTIPDVQQHDAADLLPASTQDRPGVSDTAKKAVPNTGTVPDVQQPEAHAQEWPEEAVNMLLATVAAFKDTEAKIHALMQSQPAPHGSQITLITRDTHGIAFSYTIDRSDPLLNLVHEDSRRRELDPNNVVYISDGLQIEPCDSSAVIGLQDQDVLHVVLKDTPNRQSGSSTSNWTHVRI
jgi:hypothetical protein